MIRTAYATYTNDRRDPDQGEVLGMFTHSDTGVRFEYAECFDGPGEYNRHLFVGDGTTRWAKVLKTVAYVIVDEDAYGNDVVERWPIKAHRNYA